MNDQSAGETSGLRERKKRLRREALHEAALRLVEQQGLDGTTVEQICEEVGVSARTFFNYFPSKTAAALNLHEQIFSPEAAARFRAATGELMPAICELLADSMSSGIERKRLKRLIADQPQLVTDFTQWMGTFKAEFQALVEERAVSPEMADAAIMLALAALRTLMHQPTADTRPDAVRLLETMDRLIDVRHTMLAELPG
ncbi:TetR/AcrR family transcriptional regulator [Leucobacter viscericola]|uniref:TetR/AcrR family transcriptional regulator n=1 Tax=Leucobacter viscericola TaxID=2714935 RepID=A0A6G7XIA8_9MICO|nr:TetR/AcrR family transcriptional regulator [Leucobacter viscericola]QIK64354.1 TetR/AcrR family transcriptional regulator [Leucobacter viscericola]